MIMSLKIALCGRLKSKTGIVEKSTTRESGLVFSSKERIIGIEFSMSASVVSGEIDGICSFKPSNPESDLKNGLFTTRPFQSNWHSRFFNCLQNAILSLGTGLSNMDSMPENSQRGSNTLLVLCTMILSQEPETGVASKDFPITCKSLIRSRIALITQGNSCGESVPIALEW